MTGIRKRAVDRPDAAPGPKRFGLGSGMVGDGVGDRRHHGGDDQAVYAFAREDLDYGGTDSAASLPNGWFGENLTTSGLDLDGSLIGERWTIGDRWCWSLRPAHPVRDLRGANGHQRLAEDVHGSRPQWRVPLRDPGRRGAARRLGPWWPAPSTTSTCRRRSGRLWATSTPSSTCWPRLPARARGGGAPRDASRRRAKGT